MENYLVSIKTLSLVLFLSLGIVNICQAQLLMRMGGAAYYDDELDISWIADANLAATNQFGVTTTTSNTLTLQQGIRVDGLFVGRMDWGTAIDWIAGMNANNNGTGYLGVNNWRLNRASPVNGIAFNYAKLFDGSSDKGWNITSTKSELSYMSYQNLGNVGVFDTLGNFTGCTGPNLCLTETGPFSNIQADAYWTDVIYDEDPIDYVWAFGFQHGAQQNYYKPNQFYAWAVSDGDISAVPLPASIWFLLTGIGVLYGRQQCKSR